MALLMDTDRPASPFFPFLPRTHSFNDKLAVIRAASSSGADSQASDSSASALRRRSVRWNRSKWSREPSQTDVSNPAQELEEGDFPLSHTRTLAGDADNVECGDSDCEIGYHSDTPIDLEASKLITLKRVIAAREARLYDRRDDDEDTDDALDDPYQPADLPRHTFALQRYANRRAPSDSDEASSGGNIDMDVDSIHQDEYDDDAEPEEAESEYEAPVLRKRKRKVDIPPTGTRSQAFTTSGRPSRTKFTMSGPPSVGTPDAEDSPDVNVRPAAKKTNSNRRFHGKRPRIEVQDDKAQLQSQPASASSGGSATAMHQISVPHVVPGVLEFPCRYISPEGRACNKKFPRWTDYEKHYESSHIGDSGYPWSYKVEAKDCPFRCPHPIPSASRPKSQKGRLIKTVEYGPCDFVTRKNTHDFERHWKGNHIRSEALFIARGNMQLEDAKWVNVKEKFEIAYALCPRCPRCSENFTRTDALTRHLRSPCSGGSVGAAVDDGSVSASFQQTTPVHFVEIKDAKSVKEMLDAQTVHAAPA
ncbi:hypothetical protein FRB91_004350, partial [Serendipita sp. 411]